MLLDSPVRGSYLQTSSLCEIRVGLIADTHGLLRHEALEALSGVEFIIHAGDVGQQIILETLGQLAPVYAVRGNVDRGAWAEALPLSRQIVVNELGLYIYHGYEVLEVDPKELGCQVVVSGHSHKAKPDIIDDVLYLNPGSAGPRRFKLPVTLMRLYIRGEDVRYEIIELERSK